MVWRVLRSCEARDPAQLYSKLGTALQFNGIQQQWKSVLIACEWRQSNRLKMWMPPFSAVQLCVVWIVTVFNHNGT